MKHRILAPEQAAAMGRKGGKAIGFCKVRGTSAYYQAISKLKKRKSNIPLPVVEEQPGIVIIKRTHEPPPKEIAIAATPPQGPPLSPKINPILRAFIKQTGGAP